MLLSFATAVLVAKSVVDVDGGGGCRCWSDGESSMVMPPTMILLKSTEVEKMPMMMMMMKSTMARRPRLRHQEVAVAEVAASIILSCLWEIRSKPWRQVVSYYCMLWRTGRSLSEVRE
jgi:hypothetical protein